MKHVFSDYKKIDVNTVEGRKQMFGAITAFMQQPLLAQKKLVEMGTTQFTGTADFAVEIRELIEKYHLGLGELDVGYLNFFDVRDFSGTGAPGFRIRDVSSGLTFSKRPEGGKANIYKVSGTEVFVGFDTYGGGLEFDQAWVQDQQWWMLEDSAAEFRAKWYRDKGLTMYDMIGNLTSGNNVAWVAGDSTLIRDIATLNAAAAALLTALNTAGYAVTAQTPIKVLSPIQLKGRLNAALAAQNLPLGAVGAVDKVEYNIEPVYSLNVRNANAACTDKWYMGVPGMKNKLGEKMPITIYTDFNIETFATTAVGWGRYGALMNAAQWRRLATA